MDQARITAIGAAVLLCLCAAAHADPGMDQLIQEFFVAETVYTQDKGETQLTLTPSLWRFRNQDQEGISFHAEYGITDNLQVEADLPYEHLVSLGPAPPSIPAPSGRGMTDTSAGLLYGIFLKDDPVALSVRADMSIPTGDEERGLGAGSPGWNATLIAARSIGSAQLHADVEDDFAGGTSTLKYDAAVVGVWRRLRPTFELNGLAPNYAGNQFYVTPGSYYHINSQLECGVGVPIGLDRSSAKYGAVGKLTWEFGGKGYAD